jgi:hypothetical protein
MLRFLLVTIRKLNLILVSIFPPLKKRIRTMSKHCLITALDPLKNIAITCNFCCISELVLRVIILGKKFC